MQAKVSYLSDLKFNLETWKRELRFHFNEMDTFEEKLEEIASREFGKQATIPLENFQNKIMIEKNAISKLMHRIRNKMANINNADFNENIDGRLQNEQHTLKEDMRTYIRMHYDLKEDMMDYFREWL
ncbi:hypothetical protein MWU58_10600 [Flavobacteriaceae bacterium S0825]|jgi:pyruvate formate-lyase activating enzyme-like uncharacterized protein|uniref:hypothetical protein n=1 Tax=Gaetbulibacter sp. S0825 TaxID=2720084 RepID=UPI001431761B|nr:hypothetical protein [Gaetbulibacter sp. S0825]MCK0109746.1 hypothetical protein [Flavobacteriaceae bacterium S0825]MCK0179252.1 hypothetical protein [Flavobacteriaceae bacterium S0862]NIX65378.1 hypothetical protein [Gaetbulibacter sp. S0825]